VTELEQQPIHHLLVIEDKQGKRTIALEAATCSIGRDPSNSIALNSNLVSRQHAILLRLTTPDSARYLFRLIDGNLQGKRSTNGMTVNGKRCAAHDLRHGDIIVFGGDVRARYYASTNPLDVELLTSCEAEDLSGFLSNLVNPFETFVASKGEQEYSSEGALARLASFPEMITNPILEINLTGTITYLNPAAATQFPGIRATKLQHPVLAGLLETVKGGKGKFFTREVAINQQIFEQSVHYIAESELVRTYLVNITARKQAEAALKQSQQKLSLHVQQTPLAVIEWSPDFKVIDWNPSATALFGYRKSELAGCDAARMLIPESAREPINRIWNQLLTQKCGTRSTQENLTKDGRTIICEWYNTPLIDHNGNVIGVTSLVQDITERKQAEVALQNAHSELEIKVAERTAELQQINEQLQREIVERLRAEEEVRLLQALTQAISESQDFHSALGVALQQVCEATGWSYGEAWIPDLTSGALHRSPAWYGASSNPDQLHSRSSDVDLTTGKISLENFRRLNEELTLSPATRLLGRVCMSGQPEWMQDVSSLAESVFLGVKATQEIGFKAGLAIPIVNRSSQAETPETLAILVFFMLTSREEDKRLVQLVSTAATQLGSLIQRKRAEEALQRSFATNRALLNAIPDLMLRIRKDGTLVNFKAPKDDPLLRFRSDFLGKNLAEVLPQEVAQPAMEHIAQALKTGDVQVFEYQLPTDGNLRDYEARIVISAEDEVMAIIRDITERKRAEADIRNALAKEKELGELKSRFVTMASHEFRTPLTTILSSTELLEHYSHKWNEEKKAVHLQRIQSAVNHMTWLLNDVLLIGKAEAGKLEFKPVPLNLTHFCSDLIEGIQISTSSHTLNFRTQEQHLEAVMDEKLLRHILSNLLSNAIKYSPQGGTVYFDLACSQGQVLFQVRDEGIGIPAADQAKLFDSFHRASNVGTIPGTGLGLAIVKNSVDLHGGTIAVNSGVGVGTTFIVSLPLNKQVINQ